MDQRVFMALGEELCKEAGLADWWEKFKDLFRSQDSLAERRANTLFDPGTSAAAKWNSVAKGSGSASFVKAVQNHPSADPEIKQHVQSLYDLTKGQTLGKMESSSGKGLSYEVKRLPGGQFGCTCNDWRYRGSITPGYECKHIRAFREGKTKVSSFQESTSSFFDELAKIQLARRKALEDDYRKSNHGAFYNALLQGEVPGDYPSTAPDPTDMQLVIG